jgi:ribosomal protein S18 acetylase RimI-like enzyme
MIRRATVDDATALAALAERTFADTFAAENSVADIAQHAREHYGEAIQRDELARADWITLVAETDGALVAFAVLRVGSRLPEIDAGFGSASAVEIWRFYVDRSQHGTGLATRLMQVCRAETRQCGAGVVWLGVWERNARAIRFYEKEGFGDVGSHPYVVGTDVQTDRLMARAP